jgi:hypothetical protein
MWHIRPRLWADLRFFGCSPRLSEGVKEPSGS